MIPSSDLNNAYRGDISWEIMAVSTYVDETLSPLIFSTSCRKAWCSGSIGDKGISPASTPQQTPSDPQFIAMLTGFRQRATTAAWADIWWLQSSARAAHARFHYWYSKAFVLNYKYTALILITAFFPPCRWDTVACGNTHLGVLSSRSQRGLLSLRHKEKWQLMWFTGDRFSSI